MRLEIHRPTPPPYVLACTERGDTVKVEVDPDDVQVRVINYCDASLTETVTTAAFSRSDWIALVGAVEKLMVRESF